MIIKFKYSNFGLRNLFYVPFLSLCFTSILSGQALHIYGGKDNKEYLGCLNCNKYDRNSIWNAYGKYGSKYNSNSIWNEYGTYGSIYNSYSPWNAYSSFSPVIVDEQGGFYGYFTMNLYRSQRANFDLVNIIYKYHELIKDDVSTWYDKIFD